MPQALEALLTSLTVSVIPESACRTVSEAAGPLDAREATRAFLASFSPLHRDVFVYLIRYLPSAGHRGARLVLSVLPWWGCQSWYAEDESNYSCSRICMVHCLMEHATQVWKRAAFSCAFVALFFSFVYGCDCLASARCIANFKRYSWPYQDPTKADKLDHEI